MPEPDKQEPVGVDEHIVELQRSLNRAGTDLLGRAPRPDKSAAIFAPPIMLSGPAPASVRESAEPAVGSEAENQRLRAQLAKAQAEAESIKTQWRAVQRAVPPTPPNVQREADLARTASQLSRVQRDLAAERRARAAETEAAASSIHDLQSKLAAQNGTFSLRSWKWIGAGTAAVAVGILCISRFTAAAPAAPPVFPGAQPSGPRLEELSKGLRKEGPKQQRTHARSGSPDLPASLLRLNAALSSVPGRTSQEVLHDVQRSSGPGNSACAFEWTHGGPALLFGKNESSDLSSLANTLNRCADAVEQLH